MIVNPSAFDPSLTSDEVYEIVNTLPFGYSGLSQQMHYWGRLFGVVTGEQNEQDWDNFVVNQCLRDSIWTTLRATTDETESFLGYNLARRYHKISLSNIAFDKPFRIMPGIESVNYKPTYTTIVDFEAVNISPFLIEDLVAVLEGSRYYVLLPDSLVDNPHNVLLRRASDYGVYEPDHTRRPTKVGSDWKVYIDNQPTPYVADSLIIVQSVKYVYVDVEVPTLMSGTFEPVFAGTNERIPQAKPPQALGGGLTRYWFYIWTLVDPAFYNSPVNLIYAEFYKLMPIIAFKQYTEVLDYGVLDADCSGCQDCGAGLHKYQVSATIVDSVRGIVMFNVDGELLDKDLDGIYEYLDSACDNCAANLLCNTCSYHLSFQYITNPNYLDEKLRMALPEVMRALVFRVAAELPMVDCGCIEVVGDKVNTGFISRQQESFATTTSFFGTTSVQYQYGDLRGQKAYAELMSKVPRVKYVYL